MKQLLVREKTCQWSDQDNNKVAASANLLVLLSSPRDLLQVALAALFFPPSRSSLALLFLSFPLELLQLALAPFYLLFSLVFLPPPFILPPLLPLPLVLLQTFILPLWTSFILCRSLLTITILLLSLFFQGKLDVFCYHLKIIMPFNVLSAY